MCIQVICIQPGQLVWTERINIHALCFHLQLIPTDSGVWLFGLEWQVQNMVDRLPGADSVAFCHADPGSRVDG